MTRRVSSTFIRGDALFAEWREGVLTGAEPTLFPHTLPVPEISPGQVVLLGGAPGAGKTAFVMACVVEALRATPTLRALVANVEMTPAVLLDRQLARLSGIPADVIRHRRFGAEHAERLQVGLATVESFSERLAFLEPPYDVANTAHASDEHGADLLVIDYVQRFQPLGEAADPRLRANAVMDCLRRFAGQGCAVLALSAVGRSRDTHGRSTYSAAAMGLASFRDSGELEYGADAAYLLAPAREANPSIVRLACLKNRHGEPRSIELAFDRATQAFSPLDRAGTGGSPIARKRGKRAPNQQAVPDPALAPERLAELWNRTPAAPAGEVNEQGIET